MIDLLFWSLISGMFGWFLGLFSGIRAANRRNVPETTITFPGDLEDFWEEMERRFG